MSTPNEEGRDFARRDRRPRRRGEADRFGQSTPSFALLVAPLLATVLANAACEPGRTGDDHAAGKTLWSAAKDEGAKRPLADRFAAALDEQDPLDRHMQLAAVYEEVQATDVPALLEVFERDLRARRPEEVRAFANLLARKDPETAFSEVVGWNFPLASAFGQAEVMSISVASGNFEKVRKAWREKSAGAPVETIHQGEMAMVEALARHRELDPIVEILTATNDVDHRRRMVAKVALVMSQTAGTLYPDWAEQLHRDARLKPDLEDEVLLQAVRLLTLGGPELGTAYYERIKDARCSGDALAVIGEQWAYSDPQAALAYMKARPPSEKSGMGKRAVAIIWLQRDPAKAEPVLREAIERDPGMSSVILPLAQFQMTTDLPASMLLAQRIPDDEERAIALKQGLMRWVQRDPVAVEAFMAAHPVSDEVEQAVRNVQKMRQNRAGA